jgi:PAS domain S-box-containing protein
MEKLIRILHLEDKRFDADMVKRELSKYDHTYELFWVWDKKSFQSALFEFVPDIILSDHSLPSFTSRQALKMVRDAGMDIPFILITATITDEEAIDFMKDGVSDYILKDRIHRLAASIDNSMERYAGAKQKEKYMEELSGNEKRFRAMIEKSSDMIFLSRPGERTLYASPSVTPILGFSQEEFLDRPGAGLVHPEDLPGLFESMTELLKSPGRSVYHKHRIQHKAGHYVWCEGTVTNLLEDPNVGAFVSNFRDISERQSHEEALLLNKKRLKEAQHIGKLGSWEVDVATGAQIWSDELFVIYGFEKDKVSPSTELFLSIVHPEDLADALKMTTETYADASFYLRFIRKDGTLRHANIECKFECAPNGIPLRVYGIVQDITTSKEAEKNLEHEIRLSRKHQSMLLSSQINPHFIFNALNSVQYFMLLKEDMELALNFVADFSLLMRTALKNSRSEFIPVADEVQFLELYLNLEEKRLMKKFSYSIEVDPELAEEGIHVPPMVIQPYLENSVIHGITNSENPGRILISFSKEGERVICTLTDNGVGRKKSAESRDQNPNSKKHESVGMLITETRIKLLNDLYDGEFGVCVTDLSDGGNPKGTEVKISLPLIDEAMMDELTEGF